MTNGNCNQYRNHVLLVFTQEGYNRYESSQLFSIQIMMSMMFCVFLKRLRLYNMIMQMKRKALMKRMEVVVVECCLITLVIAFMSIIILMLLPQCSIIHVNERWRTNWKRFPGQIVFRNWWLSSTGIMMRGGIVV
jgi:glucan phosphoethanolaminetransferase (alkaline phosphatase superfamily)